MFTCLAIYIYGEEPESCKYKVPPSTYVSPKDYPSARYAPIEAVQRARSSWCQPTYVSYTDSVEWARLQERDSSKNSDLTGNQSGVSVGQFQEAQSVVNMDACPKGGNCNTDYQTGTRMRNCETGTTADQSVYSSRAYNSGALWGNNSGDDCRMISPV